MQKTAIHITVTTLVISVFGGFLHWLQMMNAFEKDTGLAVPGSLTSIVYLIYSVVAIAALCVIVLAWMRQCSGSADSDHALKTSGAVTVVLSWLICACITGASCYLMFSLQEVRYVMFQRIFGAFGVVAGLCVPCLNIRRDDDSLRTFARPAAAVLTLFFCFWLIFFYKTVSSENPIVLAYAVETLAIASAAVGMYYIAAFYFGVGKKNRALIAVQLAAYFNIGALADEKNAAISLMLGATAVMMLIAEYLIIRNLKTPDRGE